MARASDSEAPIVRAPTKPSSRSRGLRTVAASWKSFLGAAVLLQLDIGFEGSYLHSIVICPIWFLVSVATNIISRPGWGIALFRVAIPATTLGIVLVNTDWQWKMGDANAAVVIRAVEEFRDINGRFPTNLEELVPRFLSSIPRAKNCGRGEFLYIGSNEPILAWHKIGFCRKVYSFRTKQWRHLD
jgi:hypothetical protein